MSVLSMTSDAFTCIANGDTFYIGYDNPTNISMKDSMDTWFMEMNELKIKQKFNEIEELFVIHQQLIMNIKIQEEEDIQDKKDFDEMLGWLKTDSDSLYSSDRTSDSADDSYSYSYLESDSLSESSDSPDDDMFYDGDVDFECFIFESKTKAKKNKKNAYIPTVHIPHKDEDGVTLNHKANNIKKTTKPDRTKSAKAKKVSRIIRARISI